MRRQRESLDNRENMVSKAVLYAKMRYQVQMQEMQQLLKKLDVDCRYSHQALLNQVNARLADAYAQIGELQRQLCLAERPCAPRSASSLLCADEPK